MPKVQDIINIRVSALQRQVENVKSLITEPRGVFETIDSMIRTARMANRETLKAIGVGVPGLGGMKISGAGILQNITRKLGTNVRRLIRR